MYYLVPFLASLCLLPLVAVAGETAGSAPGIDEWEVPWPRTRPRDPYAETAGRVWFVGQGGNYVARLDVSAGEFTRYELPAGAAPHNLIVDDQGRVWYAGNGDAHIGILDPADGSVETIELSPDRAPDPHTLVFDQSGHIWFTVQGGNHIGRLDMASHDVDLVPVPTSGARPYGIAVDADGQPWIALFGTRKLATVNPSTLRLREIDLPREDARPRRIGLGSDGAVWYVDYARGYLGRYDPGTRTFREWRTPAAGDSAPYAMAVDRHDHVWLVETGISPNRLVGFDPEQESFFSSAEIPSGGGTVRHMYYHSGKHELWFGTDTNTIGRAKLP